ncbi:type III secretion system export apparatus subunit SctV [Pseudomonas stutzeri]|uniref:type III secretion system export apparatus subunit SctV n=1 Tax=Stutzerimonas stutzeri TaxID=316 RepID=UPI00210C5B15|nr:type III secretion system export apparatus subunit SctV [Stutzerimonas stutzeri]MCQ4308442.1 type III secretion system export apparatus subunit SctV [Stutzerimonas stutzeri]
MTLAPLNRLAQLAAGRSDVVIAAFMLLAVAMMIMPLPTWLVDLLIGINIAFSLLILVVAFYLTRAVDFSALPPVILLSTLFRLALSITTTRLILLEGDAGEIVQAFGEFVIAGEVLIGLVVFLIITVAQFLVITKGSERVAEVAARFTLDAMPGKQMSIDNDLRNGDIDQQEARTRRSRLERESQLYGAMDGAMKFVKGDAIAGLVILFVNLFGGWMIGMLKRGMPFDEALHTYSLLTVGDGLIAQIPALLIAVAAGTVVTRVASEDERDLGAEIVGQLGANSRALGLTAVILGGMAIVPGFPAPVFLALSAILGAFAYRLARRERPVQAAGADPVLESLIATPPAEPQVGPALVESDDRNCRVTLWLGSALERDLVLDAVRAQADEARQQVMDELGIELPRVGVRCDPSAAQGRIGVDIDGVPIAEASVAPGCLQVLDDTVTLSLAGFDAQSLPPLIGRRETLWVERGARTALNEAGVACRGIDEALGAYLAHTLRRYAAEFLGIQETRQLLSRMEAEYPELVKEAQRVVSLQRTSEVFRRLLDEGTALRNLRGVLEALVEWGGRDLEIHVLSEHVRAALSRQICHRHADGNRVIAAFTLTRPLEEAIRQALRRSDRAQALPEALSRGVLSQLQGHYDGLSGNLEPVLMTSPDLRRYLRQLVVRQGLDIAVLSFQDLTREFSVQPLAPVELPRGYKPSPERAPASLAAS